MSSHRIRAPALHFVSLNGEFIDEVKTRFADVPGCEFTLDSIADVDRENAAFISPANSLGFMDGGIDYVLSREMFKGVERRVRARVRELDIPTLLGRPHVPVGSATAFQVGETTALISAPTMFLPHDVSKTRNAYHAFMASLAVLRKFQRTMPSLKRLVCTSLCGGCGKMAPSAIAEQLRSAYDDFVAGRIPDEIAFAAENDVFITADHNDEQPTNFDNREIKGDIKA